MHNLRSEILKGKLSQDVINLLHWVLVNQRDPYLRLVVDDRKKPDISVLLSCISEKQLPIVPNHIFEMVYSKQSETIFNKRKGNKNNSIYAFHGSRLDNFYSIYKFGLQQHMSCTVSVFIFI